MILLQNMFLCTFYHLANRLFIHFTVRFCVPLITVNLLDNLLEDECIQFLYNTGTSYNALLSILSMGSATCMGSILSCNLYG